MSLLKRLDRAIDIEYDSKNTEITEMMKLPIRERILKGDTITGCKAVFIPWGDVNETCWFNKVKITCTQNISKFREGSIVQLSGHGQSYQLEVLEDGDESLVLHDDYSVKALPPNLMESDGWQIDTATVDLRNTLKKTIELLRNDPEKRSLMSGIFEGAIRSEQKTGTRDKTQCFLKPPFDIPLNEHQLRAFTQACFSEPYFLIQGPPGSGKTWLLAALALAFALEDKKVLITAPTHTAINNALLKISDLSQYPHLVKVGKKTNTCIKVRKASAIQDVADLRYTNYDNDSQGIIVGATCYAPQTRKLEHMNWDVVIFDEAGQLSIPLAFAAMVKGKKYILMGDHQQLPPIINGMHEDEEFSRSVFEHLFQFSPGIMLETTYRMNEAVCRFPSLQFYQGKLHPEKSIAQQTLNINNQFSIHQNILDIHKPEILYCHRESSPDNRSPHEAELAVELALAYMEKGVSPEDIAIITPYRAQVRQIIRTMTSATSDESVLKHLFIDTVERMQGQERDIIIYSLSLTDPHAAGRNDEFFFDPNRLNVALTRARMKRIVLGHRRIFDLRSYRRELHSFVKVFREFYEQSTKVFQ